MGICGGTRSKPKSDNEVMELLEAQTKFNNFTFEQLRAKILHYKTTESNTITERRLIEFLNRLGLDTSKDELVMELFEKVAKKESSVYDIDKLLTIGLLYSKSTDVSNEQKVKFLHTMVEKEGPTELVTQSLREKLMDLIMIAGYWIPTIAVKNVEIKDALGDLAKYTKENKNDIVNNLIGHKYNNKRKIDTWGYKKIFKQENSIDIFSSKEIRNHISKRLNEGT
jgi:hypothetical protein